jgi:PAS domain S-box-containing protein
MPGTVLHVDPDDDARHARSKVLRDAGFEPIEAASAAGALSLAMERSPSLVLLAVRVPGVDGFEICRVLKTAPATARIPVCLVSNLGETEHRSPASAGSGAEAHLREPVTPDALIATLSALLRAASAEARAEEAEREVAGILESIGAALFRLDGEFRFTYLNREAERVLGMSRGVLLGRSLFEVFPATLGTRLEAEYRRAMNARVTARFEYRYEPWKKWYEIAAYPVSSGGMAVHFQEITRHKETEEALQQSRHLAKLASEAGLFSSFVWWIPEDRFVLSPELWKLYGREPGATEVRSSFWSECLYPGERERLESIVNECWQQRNPIADCDFRIVTPGNEIRWIHCRISFQYDDSGSPRFAVAINVDITERKQLEEQARERLEDMEKLMDVAPVAILKAQDPQCHRVTGNSLAVELFRLGKGQNMSASPVPGEAAPPIRFFRNGRELRTDELPMQEAAARNAEVRDAELEVMLPDGRRIFVLGHASPLRDANGQARGSIGTFLDISPRIFRAITGQEQNAQRMKLLAHAIESIDECVSVCDPEDRIIFVNRAFVRTYGYQEQELIGQPIAKVRSPFNPPEAMAGILPDTLAGHWQGELWNRRKDGGDFPILLTTSPVLDECGRLEATVGVATDITGRKRAERLLRESQQQLQRVIEGSKDGFWDWNIATNHVTFGGRWAAMLGYRVDELDCRYETWENLVHPEDKPRVLKALADYLEGRTESYEAEHRLRAKDGKWKWILTRGRVVSRDTQGKPLFASGTHTDISQRKRVELIQASRSKVLEQFYNEAKLEDILTVVLRHAEDVFPDCPASILLLDEQRRLRHGASHGLPEFYNQTIDGVEIGPNVGSCGAAAYWGRRIVVEDIETHPNWAPYLELARKAGLRACWSEPIPSPTGIVLGTFAIYGLAPGAPAEEDLQLLQDSARLVGLVLERRRVEETLRKTEFALNRAQAVAHVGSWYFDVAEDRLVWSEETYRIFRKPPGSPLTYEIFLEAVHPGDRAEVHQAWTAALQGGRHSIEHRILIDGEVRWTRADAEIELDAQGRWRGVGTVQDITERKTAELALQDSQRALVKSQEELRRLAGGLFQMQEDERRRISLELHDDLCQRLAMVAVEAEIIERDVPATSKAARERLRSLKSQAAALADDVRRTAHQLHPAILEHLGLVAALRSYATQISGQGRLRVRFTHRAMPDSVPREIALCLYRVAQEALRNAEKYSGQTEASVSLIGARGEIRLSIADRGVGFDLAQARGKGGLGIVSIEERVRWAGGRLTIKTQPGEGTRLDVRIPLTRTIL